MSKEKDGGPAFPVWELNGHGQPEMTSFGMTLRDRFAGEALPVVYADYMAMFEKEGCPGPDWRDGVAKDAYLMADAMLKARGTQ